MEKVMKLNHGLGRASSKEYEPCSACNNNKKNNLYSQQVEKQLRVALQNMLVLTD